jgi:DNA-binding winged helix-turn-helix (wHTH) protein
MPNASTAAFRANNPNGPTRRNGSRLAPAMPRGDAHPLTSSFNPADEARGEELRFGPFRVFAYQRLLLDGDTPVRLGSRAFDILIALLRRPGALLSKDELIAQVWPDTTVEEANLRFHMTALRKALRDHDKNNALICNVPGRGYRFAAPVLRSEVPPAAVPHADAAPAASGLPTSHTRMFGRSDLIGKLTAQLPGHRFITLVGPGGIGKTRVAVATAEALDGSYAHGVRFVDLASVVEPSKVAHALAMALGIEARCEDPTPDLISCLGEKQMLIVFDNCEHVVDATACLIEKLCTAASAVHIGDQPRAAARHRRAGAAPSAAALPAGIRVAHGGASLDLSGRPALCRSDFSDRRRIRAQR